VIQKYGIPLQDLSTHCTDAVEAAERSRARTLILRDGTAVAAIVPMSDYERVEPPDPASSGTDPLLALCGSSAHDDFVDSLSNDMSQTQLWFRR